MGNADQLDFYKGPTINSELKKKKTDFLFIDEFISIEFDAANQWLYVNWIGYQSEDTIKKGCEKILVAMKESGVSKVLNDNTKVIGIWTPASNWVGTNWLPRMEAAGLKQFAWVYSPSRLSQLSTNEAISSTPAPNLVHTFYCKADAEKWLRQSVI